VYFFCSFLWQLKIFFACFLWIRSGVNADPDPDPALCLNADPDPGSQISVGPDPGQTFKSQKLNFSMKIIFT
jgi:hypothetical protein